MEELEKSFFRDLKNPLVKEVHAKQAARVLLYYSKRKSFGNDFSAQRISDIWRGMRTLNIEPYIEEGTKVEPLNRVESIAYHEIESISIGLAVGKSQNLIGSCEWDTKYFLSNKGLEFIDR